MGGGNSELHIMRYYLESSAPTGECQRYETEDGRRWHDAQPFERVEGYRIGDVVIPRQDGEE